MVALVVMVNCSTQTNNHKNDDVTQVELIIVFPQAPGDGEGQGNLECCNPWCFKESDTTEQQNNNNHPRI